MSDLKNTIAELKAIIKDLKAQADKGTTWSGADKIDIEKRIEHVNDKSKPFHTNLTESLKFDVNDLDNLETLISSDKLQWATEKSQLEKAKKDAETKKTNKEKELNDEKNAHQKTKTEVADKLTSDLVNGLNKLINTGLKKPKKDDKGNDVKDANGNIVYEEIFDDTKITAIKTVVEELKNKGLQADLSSLDSKFKELGEKVEKIPAKSDKPNYWIIATCILSALAFLGVIFLIFTNSKKEKFVNEE